MSALSWVRDNMSPSVASRWVFLAYTWVSFLGHVKIADVGHIPGEKMGVVDGLSRFKPTPELLGFPNWSHILPIRLLDALFLLCDPSVDLDMNELGNPSFPSWEQSIISVIAAVKDCLKGW